MDLFHLILSFKVSFFLYWRRRISLNNYSVQIVAISARAELWGNVGALHVGGKYLQLLWSVRGEEILRWFLLLIQLSRSDWNANVSDKETTH